MLPLGIAVPGGQGKDHPVALPLYVCFNDPLRHSKRNLASPPIQNRVPPELALASLLPTSGYWPDNHFNIPVNPLPGLIVNFVSFPLGCGLRSPRTRTRGPLLSRVLSHVTPGSTQKHLLGVSGKLLAVTSFA